MKQKEMIRVGVDCIHLPHKSRLYLYTSEEDRGWRRLYLSASE